jgi:hypothetical protein
MVTQNSSSMPVTKGMCNLHHVYIWQFRCYVAGLAVLDIFTNTETRMYQIRT